MSLEVELAISKSSVDTMPSLSR